MSIFSFCKKIAQQFTRRDTLENKKLVKMKSIFANECGLCDNPVDYFNLTQVEDKQIPICLLCRAKIENGVTWMAILQKKKANEKRRYYQKYLRIVVWLSDAN